jgi:uncharacterized membrane protein YkvA (DUF1232 family)
VEQEGRIRRWADGLKTETLAVYMAGRDPRVPWYAKALAVFVVGYALSPIDLIPDFIPVLGYLDDLIIVPVGLAIAIRLIPRDVMAECRERAGNELAEGRRASRAAIAVIVGIWLVLAAVLAVILVKVLG